jgi:hypothetical protein
LAKALPCVALGKGHSEKKWPAKQPLPSAICRALGKGFAECRSSTRLRKGAVTAPETVTAALPSANLAGNRQRFFIFLKILCRVPPGLALGKVFYFF